LVAYNLLVSLWGWSTPAPAIAGRRQRRFRVVVPAHDEAAVIASLLGDLRAQHYDPSRVRTCVVADRCSDGTVDQARALAEVAERSDGEPGKGEALRWYLDRAPLEPGEALVVLDADNRVPEDLLARLADELDAGGLAVQAYLDVVNPEGSVLSTASALSYWASNRMVQLARTNLGWTADLGGTGMCVTDTALATAGGFTGSVTEDQDLTARLALAGVRVRWAHDVRGRDEKPEELGVALRQRERWMAGRREVARRYAWLLLRRAVRQRDGAALDLAIRLVQPGRMFIALLCALLAVVASVSGSRLLLPWIAWASAAAAAFLLPIAFLWRDRVAPRYLVRYPLVTVLAVLWLPVRVLGQRRRPWERTPHSVRPRSPSPPP
jgi:cellulose synthase/poly-beta-1,6-N-acetylglucosamine synthase-like glycosyltransferase